MGLHIGGGPVPAADGEELRRKRKAGLKNLRAGGPLSEGHSKDMKKNRGGVRFC